MADNEQSLRQKMNNAITVDNYMFIMNSNPNDVRQTCDTVDEFQEIKSTTGLELRYDGLITFERKTKLWKGCKKTESGIFEWIDITKQVNLDLSKYALADHTHKEYLPSVSEVMPDESMPNGHVWIDLN